MILRIYFLGDETGETGRKLTSFENDIRKFDGNTRFWSNSDQKRPKMAHVLLKLGVSLSSVFNVRVLKVNPDDTDHYSIFRRGFLSLL